MCNACGWSYLVPSSFAISRIMVFNICKARRGSTATWRKVLRLAAAAAVASGSRGEEREHAALARRSAEAAAGSGKATASLPRAAHTGRLCVEEAPPGVEPSQVVVPPPEEKGWRRGGLCP